MVTIARLGRNCSNRPGSTDIAWMLEMMKMKTHRAWMLACSFFVAMSLGQANGETPVPVANPGYGTFSPLGSVVKQASHNACGACNGAGCGICGQPADIGALPAACDDCAGAADCCGGSCGGACGSGLRMFGGMAADYAAATGYPAPRIGSQNGPFGGGGCCEPVWYDFHVEYLYLERDYDQPSFDLSSDGAAGPIILNTSDVDSDWSDGFRATYAWLVGPSSDIEISYFGMFSDDETSVTGPGDIFSVYSDYGNTPIGGFPGSVDAADFHGIEMESEIQNIELNLRRRWTSAGCILHGSYLAGVRYVNLSEEFDFNARVAGGGSLDYEVAADNDAVGFQLGADLFVCISPRFKIGVEAEGGVYGNDATVTEIADASTTGGLEINDRVSDSDVAFVGEAAAIATFRVTPRFTIRGGYSILYLENFALAMDHFNPDSPFNTTTRSPLVLNDRQEVFYHGANLGFTWTW